MNSHGPVVDGRYRLVSRIGSGGMADVYLAEDLQLGRQVALKVLHRRFAEDQEFVERFRREAQSAAGLSHPNVVSVFDRGEWDGTYYIAMEYLPGRSLKTIVREHGALDPGTAIDIVLQILRAARFAHQRGIIHRDLKPHNVILDGEGRVRVTDFGIARAGASDMTQTGSIMGTAQYLSPEQAQGQPVSEASDLYSIGIVLYELLTGVLPFDGETAVTIALKQVSQQPAPPSAINPAVSAALDAIVLCALAKDPAQRFANADQFTAALTQARAGYVQDAGATARLAPTTIPALGPVPAYGAGYGPPLGVPPGYGAMAGPPTTGSWAAPASLTAMYATPPGYQVTGERSVVYAPVRSNSGAWRWWVAAVLALVIIAAVGVYLLLRPKQGTVPALAPCETVPAASAALQQVHLLPQIQQQSSNACPVGRVLYTSPSAGSVLARNAGVTLYVAAAVPHHTKRPAKPKPPAKPVARTIPTVSNEPDQQAYTQLENAGFTPQVHQAPSASVPKGFVISTSPPGGAQGQPNSAVNVLVSTGPMQETVPSLTGKSETDAASALSAAHLSVGAITTQPSTTQAPGTVLTQSVQAGSTLAQGQGVNLVLAAAPALVAVPDVLGQQQAQAADALDSAGFAVSARTRAVTDSAQFGIVVGQHPRPAKMVKHGATVVITIGTLTTSTTTTTTTTPPSSTTTLSSSTTTTTTPPSSTTTTTTTPTTVTTSSGAATTPLAGTTGPPGA